MIEEYEEIKLAVESAGFHTTPMPIQEVGDRLVCAGRREPRGLCGNSFWIATRRGRWYLGMWGLVWLYRFGSSANVAAFCVEYLQRNPSQLTRKVDDDLLANYGLVRTTFEEFEGVGD